MTAEVIRACNRLCFGAHTDDLRLVLKQPGPMMHGGQIEEETCRDR